MRKMPQSATSVALNPAEERRQRVIKYTIAMTIRVICIILMLFVQGWWLLICALGAILLPYFAVLVANQQMKSPAPEAEGVLPLSLPMTDSSQ